MAKISLRIYNREIGTLIDQGKIDEAISHCHHILKTFPKHLETYRLLGKAYLEAQRYNDAGDIFSRVLMSVPNDFVSHAGMSMIADEKNKPNEAIWHMQRAFEAQPSNAAVQGELQRLYGLRDGVEPSKIRMTSGALANVYVQGELYAQAIAEIMSVEAQDPDRMDMQVLLANAYFRSGQRVEASQIASSLLAKSPYCLDANRILVEILPETSRAENVQTYRHRVNSLDPYAAFAKGSVFNTDDVPDASINLERLDWHPGSSPQLSSGWDNSASINLDQDDQPDWLKSEGGARDPEPASAMETSPEEEIPDFMRAAGWGTSSGETEEPVSFFDSPDPEPIDSGDDEEIAQAEMPDWMKTMAPAEVLNDDEKNEMGDDMASDEWINDLLDDNEGEEKKAAESPQSNAGIDDDLSWLTDISAEKEPVAEKADDMPDWLKEMKAETPAVETEPTPVADETLISDPAIGSLGASADDQDAAMNWLESLAAKQGAKAEELITDPNARTEAAPEWVEQAKEASEKIPTASVAETPVVAESDDDLSWLTDTPAEEEPAAEKADDMPDWLQEMKEETPAVEAEPTPVADETLISDPAIGSLGASADDQDAAMNWLESLAAKQGAKAEELITDPNARTEAAPEWVEQAKEASENAPTAPPAAEVSEELSWINEVAEEEPVAEATDDTPAWLRDAKDEPATPDSETVESSEGLDWISEAAEETPVVEKVDDTPAWLRDEGETLAEVTPPVAEATPVEAPQKEEVEDDAPTWIKSMDAEASEALPPAAEAIPPAKAEDDLPGWLADMESGASKEEGAKSADEPLPAWMQTEEESVPEPQSVGASEWKPADVVEESKPSVTAEPVPEVVAIPKKKRRNRRMDTTMLRDIALMGAQSAMDEGNITAALKEYGKLVKKKRLLDETIYDLREALVDYPINIEIWQMLGDAYMRAGRLQEAIDAYTKAEKLLR